MTSELDEAGLVPGTVEVGPNSTESAYRQAEAIVARAKREADQERDAILAKAYREAGEITKKALSKVGSERRKAMIELSGTVVDLAVEIAGKIIGNELSEDAQRRLAWKYLEEVGAVDDN